MTVPFVLDFVHLGNSILAAHQAGTLGLQTHPAASTCLYTYEDGVSHCAIGCALPKDLLQRIERYGENAESVEELIAAGLIENPHPDKIVDFKDHYGERSDSDVLFLAQFFHDRACRCEYEEKDRKRYERALLRLAKDLAKGEVPTYIVV